MVSHQTLLDIADRTVAIGQGKALSKSTVSDLLRGKLNDKSGPNIRLLCDAMVDLTANDARARTTGARATRLWEEISSPTPRWSTESASHFAQREWDWGVTNVYPDTRGIRYAFSIACMNATQRPVRPEVFTATMRAAALTCIDWGPLRRHGGFQEYASLNDTGFRVWGSIEEAYGYPRRLVSISANVYGAVSCYWFGESEPAHDNPRWTVERAAFCSLLALHSLMGSSGDASICSIGSTRIRNRKVTIPTVSPDEEFTGYGWPERIFDTWEETPFPEGWVEDALDDLLTPKPAEGHPREHLVSLFGRGSLSSTPLEVYGRRLR